MLFLTAENSLLGIGRKERIGWKEQEEENCYSHVPHKINLIGAVVDICCGSRHSLALVEGNSVYSFGSNDFGQLGLGYLSSNLKVPTKLGLEGVKLIACGSLHSVVATNNNTYGFGWGNYGQFGGARMMHVESPKKIDAVAGISMKSIAAGIWHSVLVTDVGYVYAFGYNGDGQIFDGSRGEDEELPFDELAISVSCGTRHTCINFESGTSKVFGWNGKGQCIEGKNICKAFGWTSCEK